jgi:acyl carrier protein
MKKTELKSLVAGIIEADPADLSLETNLRTLPGFDSVNILSLMIALDEQAHIRLSPEKASTLALYGEIVELAAQQGVELTD